MNKNLSYINKCGRALLQFIDPDGVLSAYRVKSLVWESRPEGTRRWMLTLVLDETEVCIVGENIAEEDHIKKIRIHRNEPTIEYDGKREKSFLAALRAGGGTSGRPIAIRPPKAPENGSTEAKQVTFPWNSVANILSDELTRDTEGGEMVEAGRFEGLSLRYSEIGTVVTGIIGIPNGSVESRITVSFKEAVTSRKVILYRELGLGHNIQSECWRQGTGPRVASFKVAFDVAKNLPILYVKERRQKMKKRG